MIGQTISHYTILEKIGEGGTSVVYKAEDTTLKRHGALKFPLAQILADQVKRGRCIHEARATAALDHPNICTLHEIDEAEEKHSYRWSINIHICNPFSCAHIIK